MSIYAVSFRIADDTSMYGSYSQRWESMNDSIQGLAVGRNYWKQTTSFFTLEANEDTAWKLASAVNQKSKFDPDMDLLIVVNLSAKGYKILGVNNDSDIDAIMALR